MSEWVIAYTPQAREDWAIVKRCGQKHLPERIQYLLEAVGKDPFCNPPPFKKLNRDFRGAFSRRINQKHRLVYQVLTDERTIKVLACWGHYAD